MNETVAGKYVLTALLVITSIIYSGTSAGAENADRPASESAVVTPIDYSDYTPDYLRDMVLNRVLFYENHPSLREFHTIFVENKATSIWKRKYMTGDWGGLRGRLNDMGIIPTLTYVADIQGNPVGGDKKGFKYFHNIGLDIVFDMGRLAGVKGGRFHFSASQRSGKSLTLEDIKNTFNVAQVCCVDTYKLVNASYEQSLFEDKLNVRLGRIAGGDEFLSSPLYWLFVQNGIDGNPVGIFLNTGFSAYPNATWGVRVRTHPTKNFYIMGGVYNANPDRLKRKKHGGDLSFDGPYFLIAEIGYHLNELFHDTGLPGNYKIGAYYETGDFKNFSKPGATKNGNSGFYVLIDQMIYREKSGTGLTTEQGLHPFVALLFAPDSEINTFPFFFNGGLVYKGLIPGRDQDYAGFAVVYGKYSDKLDPSITQSTEFKLEADTMRPKDFETVLEWMYKVQITEWLNIQPDVQYIINPGGTGNIKNALVLGFQLGVSM